MADYFEIDPSLVRLLWVAAAVVTGGLAVPAYILLWIILPREDRPPVGGPGVWNDWSAEFHNETQRLTAEARRVAEDVREAGQSWRAPGYTEPQPASGEKAAPEQSVQEPWWQSERYVQRPRNHRHHPRSTGVVLVALGVLLLAANAGFFSWIEWRTMWPLIFIGLGVLLLARQAGGWGR
jgi:hypothetical protein